MKILMKEGILLGLLLTTLAIPVMAESQCIGDCYACFPNGSCKMIMENVDCSQCLRHPLYTGLCTGCHTWNATYWHPTTNCPDAELECPDMNYTKCPECYDTLNNDRDGLIDCDDPECACCCDQTEDTDDTAECVPEPITLAMTTLGILGVLGFISLKRERR